MVRLAGKDTISPRRTGSECGGRRSTRRPDLGVRAGILLGHLPVGSIPGYCLQGQQPPPQKKTPLLLFTGPLVASIRSIGAFRHRSRRRHLLVCSAAGTVQLLRTHGTESSRPSLRMGKQCIGLHGRTC